MDGIRENVQIIALIIFIVTYGSLMIFGKYRTHIALGSALIFIFLGILPLDEVFATIDWNVIMMIAGTMGIVYLFTESKMPALLADELISRMPNVKWAVVSLSLFAGIISAFVDNVATVLMVAPVALTIAKKLKISPVPSIICIALSSNLQGAATLVGDTTSILLAKAANLDFFDFFYMNNKIGMFFVVQAGAMVSVMLMLFMFRKENNKIQMKERTKVTDYFPTIMLLLTLATLIVVSFIPYKSAAAPGQLYKPEITNGLVCIVFFLIGITKELVKNKNKELVKNAFKEIDFATILLLTGLFIVIGGIKNAGIIDSVSKIISSMSGGSVFIIYSIIVWMSVFFSAFIDNIPYVATMLPVVAGISNTLGIDPNLLYFGLLCGATLGGNMTPIGASANIAGIGILRKEGYEVQAKTFMKYGIPFTLSAVTVGYVLIWFLWK
ncbi:SLC13 family permease [Alloiococcus sp. CFN-8]|uniref:SLC13 family permease n=1 Tax=Alloiococcus sp. CFN-8 TaxID=3416081 RepID=UPI003CF40292